MNERDLEILALRVKGHSFTEIAKMVRNHQTGQNGITTNCARALYRNALERKPLYERKKLKEAKIAYARLSISMQK